MIKCIYLFGNIELFFLRTSYRHVRTIGYLTTLLRLASCNSNDYYYFLWVIFDKNQDFQTKMYNGAVGLLMYHNTDMVLETIQF